LIDLRGSSVSSSRRSSALTSRHRTERRQPAPHATAPSAAHRATVPNAASPLPASAGTTLSREAQPSLLPIPHTTAPSTTISSCLCCPNQPHRALQRSPLAPLHELSIFLCPASILVTFLLGEPLSMAFFHWMNFPLPSTYLWFCLRGL
jgi:hypothetical protein